MLAEKTDEGVELSFDYDASVYRNYAEMFLVLISVFIGNILGVLSPLFFNRRNKTNPFLEETYA
jgi:hypothetical protein